MPALRGRTFMSVYADVQQRADEALPDRVVHVADLRMTWAIAHSRERTLSRAGRELTRLLRQVARAAIDRGEWVSAQLPA